MFSRTMKRGVIFFLVLTVGLTMSFALSTGDVSAATKKVKKITLKATAKTVDVGATVTVKVTKVKPAKAKKAVKWSITKGKGKATLKSKKNASVQVVGKKAGVVTIKAAAKKGKAKKTIKITVKDLKAKSIKVSSQKVILQPGDKTTVKATVTAPQKIGYKKQTTTWKSANPDVATVDAKGNITAVDRGKTEVIASNDGKTAKVQVVVQTRDASRPFTLVGYYDPKVINYVNVADDAKVQVWNESNEYTPAKNTKETILGSFVRLEDTNEDGLADLISVVKREDGTQKWDDSLIWAEDIQQGEDEPLDAEYAEEVYGREYRIPFGERQLKEYGVQDYSGTSDFLEVKDSPYWTHNDYYNAKSGKNLTLLEGYRTQSQSTTWACVMTSAVTVLDWYGLRGDLNEEDLGALRGPDRTRFFGGTSLKELETMYDTLTDLGIGTWTYIDNNNSDPEATFHNPEWIKEQLSMGHPIQVIWNSFGAHGQVIIGYDDMGTETTADDQVILMDPYDTTDHVNDGYVTMSYERLIYGVLTWDDPGEDVKYMAVWPKDNEWKGYTPSTEGGIANNNANEIGEILSSGQLAMKLFGSNGTNGKTQADIKAYYKDMVDKGWMDIYSNGLSGAALPQNELPNYNCSPYYNFIDFYHQNDASSDSENSIGNLSIVDRFMTVQQATEWTCGCTSALMVMEYFNQNGVGEDADPIETEISISSKRQDGEAGGTYLKGMHSIFDKMNAEHGQKWVTLDKNDLEDPEGEWSTIEGKSGTKYALQGGRADDGLIPYLIDNNIPIMIGSDEWGGHWQVIVGYDDMETTGTADDVLILADPYDTTDHLQEGYFIKGFERLVYGWGCAFEAWEDTPKWGAGEDAIANDFIVAIPQGFSPDADEVIEELGMN